MHQPLLGAIPWEGTQRILNPPTRAAPAPRGLWAPELAPAGFQHQGDAQESSRPGAVFEAEAPQTSLRFKQTKARARQAVNPSGMLPGQTQWSEKSLYSVFLYLKGEWKKWKTWAWLFPSAENKVETFRPGAGAVMCVASPPSSVTSV